MISPSREGRITGRDPYIATLTPRGSPSLAETEPNSEADQRSGPFSELELQARWFAGGFGNQFITTDGRPIEIVDFGRWNREAGPDFTDTSIRVDGTDLHRGAIEIDTDVRDWDRHGHATNPNFEPTVLHVFFQKPTARVFTRTPAHRDIPQVHLSSVAVRTAPPDRDRATDVGSRSIQRTQPLTPDHPTFDFVRSGPPGAINKLITEDPGRASALLHAAARHRLTRKAHALRAAAQLRGDDHAWFEALAIALGFKRNKLPFQLLAQRSSLKPAQSASSESLLFGLAGFLEVDVGLPKQPDLRAYLRRLWDQWWNLRASYERLIIPPSHWNLGGNRPANHPHRRVAALHAIAAAWPAIRPALAAGSTRETAKHLTALAHPFWDSHFTLAARRLPRPRALLGPERIRDIQINILHPIAFLQSASAWETFLRQPGPTPALAIRQSAATFFHRADSAFLRPAVHQQGLLQLQHDFDRALDPIETLERWRAFECP